MVPIFDIYDLTAIDAVYVAYVLIVCAFVAAIFTGESE